MRHRRQLAAQVLFAFPLHQFDSDAFDRATLTNVNYLSLCANCHFTSMFFAPM
jgi:hypothetical protein